MFILLCKRRVIRSTCGSYSILLLQTVFQAYLFSLLMLVQSSIRIFSTFFILTSTFLGLTIYTLVTQRDIRVKLSILFASISCLLAICACLVTFCPISYILHLITSAIIILLATSFAIIDCHVMIMSQRLGITHKDAISAALLIYVDPLLVLSHMISSMFCRKKSE